MWGGVAGRVTPKVAGSCQGGRVQPMGLAAGNKFEEGWGAVPDEDQEMNL